MSFLLLLGTVLLEGLLPFFERNSIESMCAILGERVYLCNWFHGLCVTGLCGHAWAVKFQVRGFQLVLSPLK